MSKLYMFSTTHYEFYGTGDEDEYKEDEDEINALHAKYNELTN